MDGPFQDLELLKSRPAHMTVFMRYVFTQLLDPNPLVGPLYIHYQICSRRAPSVLCVFSLLRCVCVGQLFYLSVEGYLGSSPKDARSLAPQICSHFLDPDAVRTNTHIYLRPVSLELDPACFRMT